MDDRAYEIPTVDRIIAAINSGEDGAEATRQYREIITAIGRNIENHGGKHKASLALTINFEGDPKGIDVSMKVVAKLPPVPTTKERLFVSAKGDTLTAKDPARDTMFAGDDLGRRRATPAG